MAAIKLSDGTTYTLDADNDTQDPVDGAIRLVGFQADRSVQRVSIFVEEWRKNPHVALGMYPVFSRGESGIFQFTIPVAEVLDV